MTLGFKAVWEVGGLPKSKDWALVTRKKPSLFRPESEVRSFSDCSRTFRDHRALACVFTSTTPLSWLAVSFQSGGLMSFHGIMGFLRHSWLSVPHQSLSLSWFHLESLLSRSPGLPVMYTELKDPSLTGRCSLAGASLGLCRCVVVQECSVVTNG